MHKFRKQLLATAATMALSSAAYAADMPVKAPPPMLAPVAPVANWTGFYVGAQIGGASFEPSCHTNVDFEGASSPAGDFDPCNSFGKSFGTAGSFSSAGVIGGGKIGYDWQWGSVVLGVVGEFDGTDLNGTLTNTIDNGLFTTSASAKIDWIASVRGRIGWAFNNFLFYGTGGVAFTQIKTSTNIQDDGDVFSGQSTSHKTGGVAGAGFEYMVAPHVSVVGEVLWYGFGSSTVNASNFGLTYTTAFTHQDVVAGTLGVNWRF